MEKEKLIIISGAGKRETLGQEYFEKYSGFEDYLVIGTFRTSMKKGRNLFQLDLLDKEQIDSFLEEVNVEKYREIVYVHCAGGFRFEHENDEITKEVVESINDTLKNICEGILSKIEENVKFKVCVFSSLSGEYNVPYWKSYNAGTRLNAKYLEGIRDRPNVSTREYIVSSIYTKHEISLRPYADTRYWLSSEEVVGATFEEILGEKKKVEDKIFVDNPYYNSEWFVDLKALKKRWEIEMGVLGKKVVKS